MLERLPEVRKMLYLLLQFVVKDTKGQPDEAVHKARFVSIQSVGPSLLWAWGVLPSWHMDVSTSLGVLQTLSFRGFYGDFIIYV